MANEIWTAVAEEAGNSRGGGTAKFTKGDPHGWKILIAGLPNDNW